MFEQSFVQPNSRVRTGWSLMTSFGLQALLIGAGVVVPLLNPEVLPKALAQLTLTAPPGPPPGPPPETPRAAAASRVRPQAVTRGLIEPVTMPARAVIIEDEPVQVASSGSGPWVPGGVPAVGTGDNSDFLRSLVTAAHQAQAPPPVVRPIEPPRAPTAPIVVSKGVQEALLIDKVIPLYPPIAMKARVQGVVQLTALISREGRVVQLQVLSGHPMLIASAIEAVKQWRYRPTLLSGVPMEVVTQVDVKFMLSR